MKKTLIAVSIAALLLPLTVITILLIFEINAFKENDFWYGYMAYFGTVLLASLALWQNQKAYSLSMTMLNMEKTPYIDLYEVDHTEYQDFKNCIKICIDNNDFWVEHNGKIGQTATCLFFLVKNMTDKDIVSILPLDVTARTEYDSGEIIKHKMNTVTSIAQRLKANQVIPLVIVGLTYSFPPKTQDDAKDINSYYGLPSLAIKLRIRLTNYQGENFTGSIKFNASYFPDNDDNQYPSVYNKEIPKPLLDSKQH